MTTKQSVAVYFVYHNGDKNEQIEQGIQYCFNLLKRDIQRPFSRSLNLPIFFRTSLYDDIPTDISETASITLIFAIIGNHLVTDDKWIRYLTQLKIKNNFYIIPIALNKNAYNLPEDFRNLNFINAYDFPENFYKENLFINIAHEVYRIALNQKFKEMATGNDSAIEFFLSHTKDRKQGENIAKQLKLFLDQSRLSCFFDATDIAHGYKFSEEIENHIKKSSLIAIHSDAYTSSYWCQKEIEYAKKHNRPIIAVDCLEEYEDRRFPLFTNIPAIHIQYTQDNKISEKDCYNIIIAALLETIRFFYASIQFNKYQERNWIDKNAIGIFRPPELLDIINIKNDKDSKSKQLIYPEPPVYEDELLAFKKENIDAKTVLTHRFNRLKNLKIGLSISDIEETEFVKMGICPDNLVLLSQDLGRHILSREAILIYGGDLRPGGFTAFLLDEAEIIQNRLKSRKIYIKNYVPWPIYLKKNDELLNWQAKYKKVAIFEQCNLPVNELPKKLCPSDINNFMSPNVVENHYLWSKSLSNMRKKMIKECDARVCAGGKLIGYQGCMPGVLEEILIAIKHKKPLFLLGGFGGVVNYVCNIIEKGEIPQQLTKEWQIASNSGYKMLLDYISKEDKSYLPDYEKFNEILNYQNLNNGLSNEENNKLFNTEFIDEAIYFVLEGLDRLNMN